MDECISLSRIVQPSLSCLRSSSFHFYIIRHSYHLKLIMSTVCFQLILV